MKNKIFLRIIEKCKQTELVFFLGLLCIYYAQLIHCAIDYAQLIHCADVQSLDLRSRALPGNEVGALLVNSRFILPRTSFFQNVEKCQ
jgi:hypothetical protein